MLDNNTTYQQFSFFPVENIRQTRGKPIYFRKKWHRIPESQNIEALDSDRLMIKN